MLPQIHLMVAGDKDTRISTSDNFEIREKQAYLQERCLSALSKRGIYLQDPSYNELLQLALRQDKNKRGRILKEALGDSLFFFVQKFGEKSGDINTSKVYRGPRPLDGQ